MARVVLLDGRWFDPDKAEAWDEGTFHDGRNRISKATGSQWNHQKLYLTRGGKWILYSWSQWQGSRDTCIEINDAEAAAWLVRNEHNPPRGPVAKEVTTLEVQ